MNASGDKRLGYRRWAGARFRWMVALDVGLLLVGSFFVALQPTHATGTTYTVTATDLTTNDSNCLPASCTLWQAINAANANLGTDTINFNIPGPGPFTITVPNTTPLPTITDPVI